MYKLIFIILIIIFTKNYALANEKIDSKESQDISLLKDKNYDFNYYTDGFISGKYLSSKKSDINSSIYKDFLLNGNSSEESINIIITAYSLLNYSEPYNIFELGYSYDFESNTIKCSDDLINGKVIKNTGENKYNIEVNNKSDFAWRNRAMMKARDILSLEISNGNYGNDYEYYLFIAFSYLVEGSLYEYDKIYDNLNKFFNNTNNISEIINSRFCDNFESSCIVEKMISEIYKLKNKNIKEVYEIASLYKLLNIISPKTQYIDVYNDGFYHKVDVFKYNEFSSIIAYNDYFYEEKDYILPRYYKLLNKDSDKKKNNKYESLHCSNNIYLGHVYAVPFKSVVHIINTSEVNNKIKSIEVRNSHFFDLGYQKDYYGPFIFNNKKDALKHKVSTINTFNYSSRYIYINDLKKESQSPLGDIEKVRDERKEKILPINLHKEVNNSYFKSNYNIKYDNYLNYLKEISGLDLADDFYFFKNDLTNDKKTILALANFYSKFNEKKEVLFIVNIRDLKIHNYDINSIILKEIKKDNYYKTLIYKNNNKELYAIINNENMVKVINIEGDKYGVGDFPIYHYKESNEYNLWEGNFTNKYTPDKESFNTLNPNFNCNNTKNEIEQVICRDRILLSAKAYIDLLYENKMMQCNNNDYPKVIKKFYEEKYFKTFNELSMCSNDNNKCFFNKIMSLENILKQ